MHSCMLGLSKVALVMSAIGMPEGAEPTAETTTIWWLTYKLNVLLANIYYNVMVEILDGYITMLIRYIMCTLDLMFSHLFIIFYMKIKI